MKLNEIKKLGINVIEGDIEVDAARLAEDHFFRYSGPSENYRTKAINFLIKKRVDFKSTSNSVSNVVERFVRIICPVCDQTMARENSGGSSDWTTDFSCPCCHTKASITLPCDGISFCFDRTVENVVTKTKIQGV
jgi:hypothetical protein